MRDIASDGAGTDEAPGGEEGPRRPKLKVEDKRHWARAAGGGAEEDGKGETPSLEPTVVEECRRRADEAERRLQEYIAAYRQAREEQDAFRERLARDVERRAEARFGALVAEILETADDLDLALAHAADVREAEPLARGVALARDRFVAALEKSGITRIVPDGQPFDPNFAEADHVVDAGSADLDGTVASTLRPGYVLGERVLRPARVVVARFPPAPSRR